MNEGVNSNFRERSFAPLPLCSRPQNGSTMNIRVEEATARAKVSSTQTFLHQVAHCLSFHARARGLEFCHHVFHHRAHVFHRR